MTLTEYSLPKSPCNIHQITTSGRKFDIFSGEDTDKNTVQNAPNNTI